jgi:hypothetical protein
MVRGMQEQRLRRLERAAADLGAGEEQPIVIRYVRNWRSDGPSAPEVMTGPTRRVGRVVYVNDWRPAEGVAVP